MTVEDMEPEVFKALLQFIYTDSTNFCMKRLTREGKIDLRMQLLAAADRYDVEMLKFDYEILLCKSLDIENAATMLVLADQHNCSKLKDSCIKFISCPFNRTSFFASEAYSHLKESCPDVLEDLFGLTA